jgi:hypothetical protein
MTPEVRIVTGGRPARRCRKLGRTRFRSPQRAARKRKPATDPGWSTTCRRQLKQEAARVANRIAKVLEDAQIKLGCVASDILGVSGRLIVNAITLVTRR